MLSLLPVFLNRGSENRGEWATLLDLTVAQVSKPVCKLGFTQSQDTIKDFPEDTQARIASIDVYSTLNFLLCLLKRNLLENVFFSNTDSYTLIPAPLKIINTLLLP